MRCEVLLLSLRQVSGCLGQPKINESKILSPVMQNLSVIAICISYLSETDTLDTIGKYRRVRNCIEERLSPKQSRIIAIEQIRIPSMLAKAPRP